MNPTLSVEDGLVTAAQRTKARAAAALRAMQREEGYWRGELTADTTLESDYLVLRLWMETPAGGTWATPVSDRTRRIADSILRRQRSDGGFWIYPGGPTDLSATVKAYTALRLAGYDAADERLRAARERILERGGLPAANSYTKIGLSLIGLCPARLTPTVPVEMMLLPGRFIYQMSSWTRAIVIPLSVVQATGSFLRAPDGFDLDELMPDEPRARQDEEAPSLRQRLFLQGDRLLKWWDRGGPRWVRGKALARAEAWIAEHLRTSDGLAAIYPAMMYSMMALRALGYAPDQPLLRRAEQAFDDLIIDEENRFLIQPCLSPVWDTALAAYALAEAEEEDPGGSRRASEWLLDREVRVPGDWSVKRPGVEPGGWCFEFSNDFYPDIDDTAMVMLALDHLPVDEGRRREAATRRAVDWLLAMQSRDGGWGAFDVDNNWQILTAVPFADHNAMLDPTCPDITGRVLAALCRCGLNRNDPAIRRGIDYLVREQRLDGSWYGRWGVNYIYGTCWAAAGLAAAGESVHEAHLLRAGEWLRSVQNADGGWGESCSGYDTGEFEPAASTPSQTAWALLGLMATGDVDSDSVRGGVGYLIEKQSEDGKWVETAATGTGFPGVFYLRYDLYRNYFPLLALAAFTRSRGQGELR